MTNSTPLQISNRRLGAMFDPKQKTFSPALGLMSHASTLEKIWNKLTSDESNNETNNVTPTGAQERRKASVQLLVQKLKEVSTQLIPTDGNNIVISLSNSRSLCLVVNRNQIEVQIRKPGLFNAKLFESRILLATLDKDYLLKSIKTQAENIDRCGKPSYYGELLSVAEDSESEFTKRDAERSNSPDPNATVCYVINHGSGHYGGGHPDVAKRKLFLAKMANRLATEAKDKPERVLQNDGPSKLMAARFDQNVENTVVHMFDHILQQYLDAITRPSTASLDVVFNLTGFSRGAVETIAAYNFLQLFLQKLKGSLVSMPNQVYKKLMSKLHDVLSGDGEKHFKDLLKADQLQQTLDMLSLDPARGHYSGNYGVWGKTILEPVGAKSRLFIDMAACINPAKHGGFIGYLEQKILNVSFITLQNNSDNKIHIRQHMLNSDHSSIDRGAEDNPKSQLSNSLIEKQFLGTITTTNSSANNISHANESNKNRVVNGKRDLLLHIYASSKPEQITAAASRSL